MKAIAGLLLGWAAATAAFAAEPEGPKPVTLEPAVIRRLGIATAPVIATARGVSATGFARVLDPIPLAQLDADIAAAAPAAGASAAEAARSRALFAADVTVSRRAAETATTQARGDAARLALLERRIGLEWGPAIGRLSSVQRAALVSSLAAGRSALVRIDSAGGSGQSSLRTAVLDLGGLGTTTATIMGPARAADPRLQSPGLIARVTGPKAQFLSTGLAVPVRMTGAARAGIFVPAAAVLRLQGATWVYAQTGPTAFERRRLVGTQAMPGGLFATGGVRAGQAIVTRGGAALYAAEHGGGPEEE